MSRPPIEVADVFRAHGPEFLRIRGDVVSAAKKKVLRRLASCRTAALGGHVESCSLECGYEKIAYNSCGDRHCPKCQAAARAEWLDARQADLLPVEYFHVVFTVPSAIARIALQNKRVMYDILFRASAETLKQIAADPKHLGARIGFIGLLHTWGQSLHHHPHIHYVIPGGGLCSQRERWISCRPGFFLPVRVLSRLFRGKLLALTRRAFSRGDLTFQGTLASLSDPRRFEAMLAPLYESGWVVYAKPPFGGPEQVLKYLARYTHRVAIANRRLLSLRADRVRFRYKDYAYGNRQRVMDLSALEFIRRFLLHVLPKGFVHIRHFGILANPVRVASLKRCRDILGKADVAREDDGAADKADPGEDESTTCPRCAQGSLIKRVLHPLPALTTCIPPPGIDSS